MLAPPLEQMLGVPQQLRLPVKLNVCLKNRHFADRKRALFTWIVDDVGVCTGSLRLAAGRENGWETLDVVPLGDVAQLMDEAFRGGQDSWAAWGLRTVRPDADATLGRGVVGSVGPATRE